ncbi:MAG: LLM class flavin-dependent oxidoreductase [Alphaproteobacteria bacterium]|nr:LLM class flavin-dependent oxidoreductase [Alphaproteobacteria bacterium]
MQAWYFSEGAYHYLPEESSYNSIRVSLPNAIYDPVKGADLYHRYLDEWCYADEIGLNIMTNEHHQTATNLIPAVPLIAAILARETKKVRILILGNPLANRRQPVRVAEEMAMIDVISRGRLDVGFVRGVPFEVSAMNSNPMRMSQRLWEAYELIMKAWTTHDGPFSWEGQFFHHRQVNIWPRPYQQPHPPVWITVGSPPNAAQVARLKHNAATFLSGYNVTKLIFDGYRKGWREAGHPGSGSHKLAYAALVYVGDTDAEGEAGIQELKWYNDSNKVPPQFRNPPGYFPAEAAGNVLKGAFGGQVGVDGLGRTPPPKTVEGLIQQGFAFGGNPDTVFKQIKKFYDTVGGFGHLLIMGQAGHLDHERTVKGMKRFVDHVWPRLKDELNEFRQAAE